MRDVITVDGLAGSGKSALAKALAERLGFCHLNSGLVYRVVAALTLEMGLNPTCEHDVMKALNGHGIVFRQGISGESEVAVDGLSKGAELHTPLVSEASSLVARHQVVRDAVLKIQQEAYMPHGLVAEGRDMGTVVFPEAKVKFFVQGDLDVRAMRRLDQLKQTGQSIQLEDVRRAIRERNERDASSSVGTMRQADDAVVIDNSRDPFAVVLERMLSNVKSL